MLFFLVELKFNQLIA